MMVVQSPSPFGGYDPRVAAPPMLVIDDDPANSSSTVALLAGAGYTAVAEANGDAVLRLVRASVIRMVVSELYIRSAEGRCVVATLKEDRARLPRLRVLVHTRHAAASDTEWALASGCDAIVLRGSAKGVLVREVRRLDGAPASEADR